MTEKPKRLLLNQETLRSLFEPEYDGNLIAGTHTCSPTVCGAFSCHTTPCLLNS
jgi:hypothetical protein